MAGLGEELGVGEEAECDFLFEQDDLGGCEGWQTASSPRSPARTGSCSRTDRTGRQHRTCSTSCQAGKQMVVLVLPVAALLAGEALQMVDVSPGSHHHLEGRDDFVAGRAVAGGAEQPENI